MKRIILAAATLLSTAALSGCQSSVPDTLKAEEPTCHNTSTACLIDWDRYLDLTQIAYQTCQENGNRCETLRLMLKDGRAKLTTLVALPNDEELPDRKQ